MPSKPAALTLRGVEGVAIQYAKCCRPIPGDTVVGQFRKGQGLLVHTRDCVTLQASSAPTPSSWSTSNGRATSQGVFDAGIRLLVADRRGLLADLATAIADADGNIDNVSMERPDGGEVLAMFFSVQVKRPAPPRAGDAGAEARARSAADPPRADLSSTSLSVFACRARRPASPFDSPTLSASTIARRPYSSHGWRQVKRYAFCAEACH